MDAIDELIASKNRFKEKLKQLIGGLSVELRIGFSSNLGDYRIWQVYLCTMKVVMKEAIRTGRKRVNFKFATPSAFAELPNITLVLGDGVVNNLLFRPKKQGQYLCLTLLLDVWLCFALVFVKSVTVEPKPPRPDADDWLPPQNFFIPIPNKTELGGCARSDSPTRSLIF